MNYLRWSFTRQCYLYIYMENNIMQKTYYVKVCATLFRTIHRKNKVWNTCWRWRTYYKFILLHFNMYIELQCHTLLLHGSVSFYIFFDICFRLLAIILCLHISLFGFVWGSKPLRPLAYYVFWFSYVKTYPTPSHPAVHFLFLSFLLGCGLVCLPFWQFVVEQVSYLHITPFLWDIRNCVR